MKSMDTPSTTTDVKICGKSSAISRHLRRVYSESCGFEYACVTSKDANQFVTVLTGSGPRCECFCRVVPREGQRLNELGYPSLQVRSDNKESLKHVLTAACEQVHLEFSNSRPETPASNGRGENSVLTTKEMAQRKKESINAMGITFSIKHPEFAWVVRHSEWILNHLVRNDFLVEDDNRVMKTSPHESHTGCPAPRSTSLLIVFWLVDVMMTTNSKRFQPAWFWGLIVGSVEVIALHSHGVQRHHGEWRVSLLGDSESNLCELKTTLSLMTECDWRTPG